jgi:4-amino-4-deoxy-L-arabinose transferase-like glycosyltransferase
VVALLSFGVGLFWAAAIRPLNAPDETAYLQAVMQTRQERRLPEIHFAFTANPQGEVVGTPGDAAAREYMQGQGITDPIQLLAYENVQPPLYFLITGLITQIVPPDPATILYLTRLITVVFGAGTVYFCWAATRQLAPRAPEWALMVAGVMALLPEFCFNNARLGNDSLINCLCAAAFYVWFRGLRAPAYDRYLLRAGSVVGLAILTKLTGLLLVPGLLLVVLFRAWQGRRRDGSRRHWVRQAIPLAVGAGGSAALICGWWFVRNLLVYGEWSGTGAANVFWHATLPGLNWNDPAARADFILSSWMSFWGFFGWQNIQMPAMFYDQALVLSEVLLVLSGLAGLGLLWRWVRRRLVIPTYVWQAGGLLVLTTGLVIVSFVQFSLTVALQAQGRYLFPALLPEALLFTGGLYALAPGRWGKPLAFSIPIVWLAAMNAVGLMLVRAP